MGIYRQDDAGKSRETWSHLATLYHDDLDGREPAIFTSVRAIPFDHRAKRVLEQLEANV